MSLFQPFASQADAEMFIATNFVTKEQRAMAYMLLMRTQETVLKGYSEDSEEPDSSRTVN